MQLTGLQIFIMILAVALGAMVTRFTPFLLFPEKKQPPKWVDELGKLLPAASMGLLIVYCFKSVSFLKAPYGIPELCAIVVIIILHKWKQNVLLSIGGSTLFYMFLVQVVFR